MMNGKGVKRYPLSKQVSDQLEKMIEAGEYQVGEKINTETELMEMFSVSRNTLREAIRSLTSAGVLEVRQGDGTYVRSNSRFNANMNLEYAQVALTDVTEVRNSLEVQIAYFTAMRRTQEEMREITRAFFRRNNTTESIRENTLADIEFHIAIAKACHNKILSDLYMSISSFLESHIADRQAQTELENREIERLHEELYDAIKVQDPDVAKVCAKNILKI